MKNSSAFKVFTLDRWIYAGCIMISYFSIIYLMLSGNSIYLLITFLMSLLIGSIAIPLCYHRGVCHGSVKLPKSIEVIGCLIGGLAMQGSPLAWSVVHLNHHRYSDTEKDPHSPSHNNNLMLWLLGYTFCHLHNPLYAKKFNNTWHAYFHKLYLPLYIGFFILMFFIFSFNLWVALFIAPISMTLLFAGIFTILLHKGGNPKTLMLYYPILGGQVYHYEHHQNTNLAKFGKYDFIGHLCEKYFTVKEKLAVNK